MSTTVMYLKSDMWKAIIIITMKAMKVVIKPIWKIIMKNIVIMKYSNK
jgi:hypothetical protein